MLRYCQSISLVFLWVSLFILGSVINCDYTGGDEFSSIVPDDDTVIVIVDDDDAQVDADNACVAKDILHFEDSTLRLIAGGNPGSTGTAIVKDSFGNIHVAAKKAKFLLLYTRHAPGVWSSQLIDVFPYYLDMVIDRNDNYHLAYLKESSQELFYNTNVSGVWTAKYLRTLDKVGPDVSIDVDHTNSAHIVFREEEEENEDESENKEESTPRPRTWQV